MVIETSALLLLALLLLTVPINWLLAFFVAAAVHELFHYLALRLLGGQTRGFTIRPGGAVLSVAVNGNNSKTAGPVFKIPAKRRFKRRTLAAILRMNEDRASGHFTNFIKIAVIFLSSTVVNNDYVLKAGSPKVDDRRYHFIIGLI